MEQQTDKKETWTDFLASKGADCASEIYPFFKSPEQEVLLAAKEDILADLSSLTVLRVSGEDAESFLQSQLTNDISKLDLNSSQLSAYCTAKGRMLALFLIFKRDDGFYLLADTQLVETVLKKLRMYVLRAKVVIDLLSDWAVIGISGDGAFNNLKNSFATISQENNAVSSAIKSSAVCIGGKKPRYIVAGETESGMQLWDKLSGTCSLTGHHAWAWQDIQAGLPTISTETSEAFVPQMTNLELIDGVNFKKGCYPGQEIVARMQYLGKLKQRMFRLQSGESSPPHAGDKIFSSSFPNQAAGTIVSAEPGPNSGVDILAVVQIKAVESGDLHLENETGPELTVKELPYSLI